MTPRAARRVIRSTLAFPGILSLLLLSACTSDDRTTSPSPASESVTAFSAGPLTGAVRGAVSPPAVTNSANALVTGLVGKFVRLEYHTPTPLPSASLYVTIIDEIPFHSHIYRLPVAGGEPQQLTFGALNEFNPSIDPGGTRIAYWEGNQAGENFGGTGRLMIVDADGRNPRSVGSTGPDRSGPPAWTPDGNALLYRVQDTTTHLYSLIRVEVASGDTSTLATNEYYMGQPTAGVLNGEPTAIVSIFDAFLRIRLTTLAVDTILHGVATPFVSGISPDGTRLAYGNGSGIYLGRVEDPSSFRLLQAGSVLAFDWLPDNSGVVLSELTVEGPFQFQYFVVDTLGSAARQLTNLPVIFRGPFSIGPGSSATAPTLLLGSGGILGDSASGLLISQTTAGRVASLVAFTSDQQSSVQLEQQTGLNSTAPALSFWVTAEDLTGMRAVSGPGLDSATVLIDPAFPQSSSGALVTFDAATGALALVLLSSGDPASPLQIEDRGTLRTFRGRFLQVLGPDGIDRGGGSAREVALDLATHQIRVQR